MRQVGLCYEVIGRNVSIYKHCIKYKYLLTLRVHAIFSNYHKNS